MLNRKIYYQDIHATSLSQWKYQEVYNAVDNDLETSWRGHRIYWHDNKHEQIVLDINSLQNISKVIWVNWNNTLTPTAYTIDVSLDNTIWKTVKKVTQGPERRDGEIVSERFETTPARFVRMDITGTLSNDAPALKEIEIVSNENKDVDIKEALGFVSDPISFATDKNEVDLMLSQIAPLINLEVGIKTDKGIFIKQLPVNSFDTLNTYEFILVAGGTVIEEINVWTNNLPTSLDLTSASIRNLSLAEIQERKLIKYLTK